MDNIFTTFNEQPIFKFLPIASLGGVMEVSVSTSNSVKQILFKMPVDPWN